LPYSTSGVWLAFYNDSYRRLWDLDRAFLDSNPDRFKDVLDRLRAARKVPEQPDFRPGRPSCMRPIARSSRTRIPGTCPTAAPSASSPRQTQKAASTYLFDDVTESLRPRAAL